MKNMLGRMAAGLLMACAFSSVTVIASGNAIFRGGANGVIVSVVPGSEGVEMTGEASGYATQLGKYTRVETIILDPNTGSFTGCVAFTSPSGEVLNADIAGGFTSPTTASGTYTITGGTGRFENATGAAEFSVTLVDQTHFTVEFAGVIEYRD